ncbi:uncharacterized protein LOC108673275 [Hyalella azteca]|uniref:Uncharacterized protein LOC108673275 n=1 Tax=Hyalella azteca TaxID=294128 RepID=A0A8B7NS92_HYAAZ|nr:uncharacterized protein LOC108673275 [Hyalella azteca]
MGDACDDQEGLLQPGSAAEAVVREKVVVGGCACFMHDVFRYWCHVVFTCLLLVGSAAALVITLPVYLQAVNTAGTAYVGLLFVWCVVTLLTVISFSIKYFTSLKTFWYGGHVQSVLRYGIWHGVACVAIVYALDRKRVLCHVQEPLMGLAVLYMIIMHCFYHGAVVSSGKLLCPCGVLAGLFTAMDFQLNDEYVCRGVVRQSPATDGGDWSDQQHVLWTVLYAVALLIVAIVWIQLELLLLPDNISETVPSAGVAVRSVCGEMSFHGAPSESTPADLTPGERRCPPPCADNGVSSQLVGEVVPQDDVTSVSCSSLDQLLPAPRSKCCGFRLKCPAMFTSATHVMPSCPSHAVAITDANVDALFFWFVISTFCTIASLFWTDLFTALGKSGSFDQFLNLSSHGMACHFSSNLNQCGPTALHGWLAVLYICLFLWSVKYLCLLCHSLVLPLCVASLSLPVSTVFWSLFSQAGRYGIIFTPKVTGEGACGLLGAIVVSCSLGWWLKFNKREPYCRCSHGSLPSTPSSPTAPHMFGGTRSPPDVLVYSVRTSGAAGQDSNTEDNNQAHCGRRGQDSNTEDNNQADCCRRGQDSNPEDNNEAHCGRRGQDSNPEDNNQANRVRRGLHEAHTVVEVHSP